MKTREIEVGATYAVRVGGSIRRATVVEKGVYGRVPDYTGFRRVQSARPNYIRVEVERTDGRTYGRTERVRAQDVTAPWDDYRGERDRIRAAAEARSHALTARVARVTRGFARIGIPVEAYRTYRNRAERLDLRVAGADWPALEAALEAVAVALEGGSDDT